VPCIKKGQGSLDLVTGVTGGLGTEGALAGDGEGYLPFCAKKAGRGFLGLG